MISRHLKCYHHRIAIAEATSGVRVQHGGHDVKVSRARCAEERQRYCGVLQSALREACGGETFAKLSHSYTGLNIAHHQEIEHEVDLILWCSLFYGKGRLLGNG